MLPVCSPLRWTRMGRSLSKPVALWTLTFLFVLAANACGQDSEAQSQSLADLQSKWQTINQSLDELQQKLDSGEGETESLRTQYTDLVDDANATIEKIRSAAMADIESSGGKDMAATRSLMGILLNAAKEGNDESVLKTGDFLIKQGVKPIWFETAAKSKRIPIDAREIFDELLIRQRETEADDLPRVKLTTTKGDIVIELFENEAPGTVGNFISLVEDGFYKDIDFHRVIEGFMAQTGCPDGTGGGGPGYKIECECYSPEARPHFTGSVSMAHAGKDTGGSQFYLTFQRTDFLDGRHTVFGRVAEGMEILENIQRTHLSINGREEVIPDLTKDKILSAEVVRKRDTTYLPDKVGEDKPAATSKSPAAEPSDEKSDAVDEEEKEETKDASKDE